MSEESQQPNEPATRAKKPRLTLALDADKLGKVVGAFFATILMMVCFFVQEMTFLETLFRAACTFVGVYAATYILARIILINVLREFIEQEAQRKRERRERARQGSKPAEKGLDDEEEMNGE